ncbi:hypothetical protein [Paenibacillus lactis]|uniref:Uncharacterized protein n=1 Tax=Paenibacillus lactis TaxID=228574 RepID=A0ABS4FJ76_9BACL|nr:hypothetical protein [Paenibacillus lactis]MBP1896305.1 hypothetical protein [Paenibacillus lactis]
MFSIKGGPAGQKPLDDYLFYTVWGGEGQDIHGRGGRTFLVLTAS